MRSRFPSKACFGPLAGGLALAFAATTAQAQWWEDENLYEDEAYYSEGYYDDQNADDDWYYDGYYDTYYEDDDYIGYEYGYTDYEDYSDYYADENNDWWDWF